MEATAIIRAWGDGGSNKVGNSGTIKWSDSGHIIEVTTNGLCTGCGRKRRLHDNSMIFDLRNRENRIAISLDGKFEREDQEFIYAQMTFKMPFRHPRRDAK